MSEVTIEELGYETVSKAPSQVSFYGIGTRFYGENHLKDYPGLYTKVLYFTIFFIPVFALGKYLAQVYDGNEYILGKGKLAGISKGWNASLASVLALFIAWTAFQNYTNSPEYIAKSLYAEALENIEDKDYASAVNNLAAINRGYSSVKQKAKDKLNELVQESNLNQLQPNEVFELIKSVASLPGILKEPLSIYRAYFDKFKSLSPRTASDFASLIAEASKDEAEIQKYDALNYELLSKIYDTNRDDFTLAKRFAKLEERINQCGKCIDILGPFKDRLGLSESARILGQAYAQEGNIEDAFKLLTPYVEFNLKAYHRAEKAYNDALNQEWDDTIAFLQAGRAAQNFYDKYDAASEEGKQQLVDDYYAKRRDRSAKIAKALQTYSDSTHIVPVALDLGTVLLNRSLSMSDESARKDTLKQAEQTFLSVQNYAGDSDQYQLYLGQVYYWLGNETKGEELFNTLLEKYSRSHQVLYSLSRTLRDLGAVSKSKTLLLEAYGKATEAADKNAYAQYLSLLADDLPEKIEWLEKADTSQAYVKGDLLSAKGHLAASEYKKREALNYYQQSIDVYKGIPEDATQLNNIALIYMSKYRLGYAIKDFDKALESLDKAVALVPEDSIVLSNAADQHLLKAYTNLQTPYIDLQSLEMSPSLNMFSYLYRDQKGKDIFIEKLKNHSSFKKGVSYLEKAVLLSPKNVSNLASLVAIYSFIDDQQSIEQLATRFENSELDLESYAKSRKLYLSGEDDQKSLKKINDYLANVDQLLAKKRNSAKAINSAILQSYWIASKMNASTFDGASYSTLLLNKARKVYASLPSSSTRGDLESALIYRLTEKVRAQSSKFKAIYEQYGRSINDTNLLALAMSQDKEILNFVASQGEANELQALLAESYKNFPKSPSVIDWFILNSLGNKLADKVGDALRNSPIQVSKNLLAYKQTASKEFIALHQYMMLKLQGDNEQAKKLLRTAIDNGAQIPSLGR